MFSWNAYIIYFDVVSHSSSYWEIRPIFKCDDQDYAIHDIFVLLIALENDIVTVRRNVEVADIMKLPILYDLIRKLCFAKLTHHSGKTVNVSVFSFCTMYPFWVEPFLETFYMDVHHRASAFTWGNQHVIFRVFFIQAYSTSFLTALVSLWLRLFIVDFRVWIWWHWFVWNQSRILLSKLMNWLAHIVCLLILKPSGVLVIWDLMRVLMNDLNFRIQSLNSSRVSQSPGNPSVFSSPVIFLCREICDFVLNPSKLYNKSSFQLDSLFLFISNSLKQPILHIKFFWVRLMINIVFPIYSAQGNQAFSILVLLPLSFWD